MVGVWKYPRILKPSRSFFPHPVIPLKFTPILLFFLSFLQAPNHSLPLGILPHILPVPISQYSLLFLICQVLIMHIESIEN